MNLSDGDKLMLVMLSEIYRRLNIRGEIDPELVLASVMSDQLWGLKWKYGSLLNAPGDTPPVVQETSDILDMYRALEPSFERLPKAEQERVEREAFPWGAEHHFQGFDAGDPHHRVVAYLVDTLGRYPELKGRDLDAGSSTRLPIYRRMLVRYAEITEGRAPRDGLTAEQIIDILRAPRDALPVHGNTAPADFREKARHPDRGLVKPGLVEGP